MPSTGVDKDVVRMHKRVLLSLKRNKTVPFAEMEIRLETVIQNEQVRNRKKLYNMDSMWNPEKLYR